MARNNKITRNIIVFAIGLVFTAFTLPQQALADGEVEHCITAPEGVNVTFREKASDSSEEVGLGSNGNCRLWVKPPCKNGWCFVQTHEFDGWVKEKYLRRK